MCKAQTSSSRPIPSKNQARHWRHHRPRDHHGHVRIGHLAGRLAADLPHRLDHQLEPVHVALGEIAAARVERQPSLRREQVLHLEEVVGLLGGEEAVLDQAHEHAPREVLVALHHPHVLGLHPRHVVELRRHRGEARCGVEGRIVAARGIPVFGALGYAEAVRGVRPQVARPLRRDHDDGGGAVVLHAEVVEAQGLDDPARGVVGLQRARPAVHHRARIGLRVVIRRQRDGPLRPLVDAVIMHEAHHSHGEALGRRAEAIGEGQRGLPRHRGAGRRRAKALELPLGERAEDYHAVRDAARHRGRGVAHRRRAPTSAAAPLHVGEAEGGETKGGRDARGIVAVVAVGGKTIDLAWLDASVGASTQDGLERQRELGVRRLAVLVVRGLADPRNGDLAAQRSFLSVHAAVTPPSTGSATPVTNDASSEMRKSAALAISSGLPVRPSGTAPAARFCTSSSGSIPAVDFWSGRATNTRSIGVSMGPGQTALTRIFSLARRTARLFTKPTTPNLHMEYTGLYEEPWSPDVEAVKRRLPPPRRRISGMAASVVRSTVRRFKSMARSKAAMSMPSTAAGPGCPTWFHTKSKPLKRPTVSHTMRRASSSLVRSATIPWAVPPDAAISFTTRCTPAASTSTTATCAPSFANLRAPARPIPEAAAVTIPIFPLRRIDPPLDPSVRARFYTASRSNDTIALPVATRAQRSPPCGYGILRPWRCT